MSDDSASFIYGESFIVLENDTPRRRAEFLAHYSDHKAFEPVAWMYRTMGMQSVLLRKNDTNDDNRFFVYLCAPGSTPYEKLDVGNAYLYTVDEIRSGEWQHI